MILPHQNSDIQGFLPGVQTSYYLRHKTNRHFLHGQKMLYQYANCDFYKAFFPVASQGIYPRFYSGRIDSAIGNRCVIVDENLFD